MKETLSLFLATVIILTLSLRSLKTVSAAIPAEEPVVVEKAEEKAEKETPEKEADNTESKAEEEKTEEAEKPQEEKAEKTASEPEAEETPAPTTAPAPAPTPAPTPAPAPAPAPAPTSTPAPAVQSQSNNLSAAQRLNAAPLNPRMTPFTELNNEINRILSQIITPGMSTYEKMKACYTYVATHCTYGSPSRKYYLSTAKQYREYELAITVFYEGKGKCDCYSAAVSVLARAIGIDCYTHTGWLTYMNDNHDWAEANINGTYYIFDANVEDNVTGGYGEKYFCKTYQELTEYKR